MDFPSPINPTTFERTPQSVHMLQQALNTNAAKQTSTGNSFADLLNRSTTLSTKTSEQERHDQAEKAAGDLVSNALILPMLKQLRHSTWGQDKIFGGGIGEKTFGPEFDMQIADRIAQSPNLPVRQSLAERMTRGKVIDKRAYYQALNKGMKLNG